MMNARMFCYLWFRKSNPSEVKFGERWVFPGQDPEKEVWNRIRTSLSVSKYIIEKGEVVLAHIWDVSDLAKSINRYYQRSRMDDFIRNTIPMLKNSRIGRSEFHEQLAEDVVIAINKYLAKRNQVLPEAGLAQWQYDAAEDVIFAVEQNKKIILAELCARFGKTIWIGALIRELNVQLTIVVSYVLTSFTSFINDLTNFQQFINLVLIDARDDEYQEQVEAAITAGNQVVVFVSMCKGQNRAKRLDYLFNLEVSRMVVIDEADFGMKNINQSQPLTEAVKKNDVVIIMTGTNADQAGQHWKNAHYLSCTYPELILAKRNSLQS